MALHGPDYPKQCLTAATELLELPGLPPAMVTADRLVRASSLATLGRIPEADTELDRLVPFAEQWGSPTVRVQLGWSRAGLLLLAGRWQEADAISRATYNLHSGMSYGVERSFALRARMAQRWESAYLTGTGTDLVDELRAAVKTTGAPGQRSMLTMALMGARRPEEAHALLHCLAPGPKDSRWLYMQCWSLLAAARLGETELVARLREQLLPTVSWPAWPCTCTWSAGRWPTSPARSPWPSATRMPRWLISPLPSRPTRQWAHCPG
jgi:hypothetical protein